MTRIETDAEAYARAGYQARMHREKMEGTMTPPREVTREQIEALMIGAGAAGDEAQIEICRVALARVTRLEDRRDGSIRYCLTSGTEAQMLGPWYDTRQEAVDARETARQECARVIEEVAER